MWNYSDKLKQHFLHPKNVGEIESPSTEATVGNITCGDALKLTLKIDEQGIVTDAKFKTFGCASAIASSSILTEMIIGKHIDEVGKITDQDIADLLDGMPPEKMHCSVMGQEALDKAIKKYRGEEIEEADDHDHGKVVCNCFAVTDVKIRHVVEEHNLKTIEEVTNYCKAGGACTACHNEIQKILDDVNGAQEATEKCAAIQAAQKTKPMTNLQKITLIQQTITSEIAPHLRQDGGDIELIDVQGNTVIVALRGACAGCPSSQYTLKLAVEAKLRERISPDIVVEQSQ